MTRLDLARRLVNGRRSIRPAVRRYGAKCARRGAALVEAAIVMNTFLLFIFGIFEFGHFVMVKQIMDNAARDGARMASMGPLQYTTAQITAQVTSELSGQGPSSPNIQVFQANPSTGANIGSWSNAGLGDTVAVQITGTYQPMLSIAAILPHSFTISSEAMVYSESPD
jgi:Flp pilus assembly protein TadG